MTTPTLLPQVNESPYFPEFGEVTNRAVSPYLIPGLVDYKLPAGRLETAERISTLVCKCEGMELFDVISKSRKRALVSVRHMICSLLRSAVKDITYEEIGSVMGGRDHATALHSVKTCRDYYDSNKAWRTRYDYLKGLLITHGYATIEQ